MRRHLPIPRPFCREPVIEGAGHHLKDQLPENGQEFPGVKGSPGGEEKALTGWMGADHPIAVGGVRIPLG